jgi:hypothetical protein
MFQLFYLIIIPHCSYFTHQNIFNNLKRVNLGSRIDLPNLDVLDEFFSFLRKYEEKKTYNMLFLKLDSKLKNLRLVFSFSS